MRFCNRRGMTLTEVLVGLIVTAIMVAGIAALEMTRSSLSDQARDDAGVKYPSRAEAHIATLHLSKRIETADRYVISGGGSTLQVRHYDGDNCPSAIPTPACFDNASNYSWSQYTSAGDGSFTYYEDSGSGCSGQTLIQSETSVNFSGTEDLVTFTITWTNPATGDIMEFPGQVKLLQRSQNAGLGLQAPELSVSNPPGVC